MKSFYAFLKKALGAERHLPRGEYQRRLLDYAETGQRLFVQRFLIYGIAILLAGAYYSWPLAAVFICLVVLCETYDFFVARRIRVQNVWTAKAIRSALFKLFLGTITSAVTISVFSISFAMQQSPESGHFMPMFMLVSASIFATMHNHQFLSLLATRLLIYVAAIIYIPVHDLVITSAPLGSEIWLHFFTVVFVLGFLVELARNFVSSYSDALKNLMDLEAKHEQVKMAYQAKTEFVGTVSHELRTPLTSIKGALDLMNSGVLGDVPEKMQSPIKIAQRNAIRLSAMVEDLLLLQRIDAGRLDFTYERVELNTFLQDVVDRFLPFADYKGVTVSKTLADEDFFVDCDEKRIEQVISNLLSNAAKFSESGGKITVGLERFGNYARITVADEGIGIPKDTGDRIFEAFNQLDTSASRKFEGTGLGLNISRKIVEAHDGLLSYGSELGKGTTFFVDLPIHHDGVVT
ncbi:sensor histidine kinase [Celeribacter halophilus]|uniref:sensor histidine kinase n=1 Tax=Celeribacter halophilus TaxID=576117 RepID=UPI001C085293|nr:ATP-binding protein [Celeribacter halophilus]MBU2891300.1 cell wall metabolism sensor histidine kinase WalK [Celeribacter halophilus]MDO6512177.1 ATP-binding protein [Celeribacter halophilus]